MTTSEQILSLHLEKQLLRKFNSKHLAVKKELLAFKMKVGCKEWQGPVVVEDDDDEESEDAKSTEGWVS